MPLYPYLYKPHAYTNSTRLTGAVLMMVEMSESAVFSVSSVRESSDSIITIVWNRPRSFAAADSVCKASSTAYVGRPVSQGYR